MMACFKLKRRDRDEKLLIKNGGVLLEELIALCNGRSNIPLLHFSANDLRRATNNYNTRQMVFQDSGYILYQGTLKDRQIFVKKYDEVWDLVPAMAYKDIAIGSQMSIHNNVLTLTGYCLGTEHPIIVYEFGGNTKFLSECIYATAVEPLSWKCRLKIAVDLANAIAYLHTAFSRPIIHRDIKSASIILDENNVPKLIDFGLCISIPEGKSHVEDAIVGRSGFAAPEYVRSGYLTEKADVYSFGVLLFELLSGQRLQDYKREHGWFDYSNGCVEQLCNVVNPRITDEGIEVEQLLDFATLVDRCRSEDENLRPTMTDAGKELRRIYQATFPSPC